MEMIPTAVDAHRRPISLSLVRVARELPPREAALLWPHIVRLRTLDVDPGADASQR